MSNAVSNELFVVLPNKIQLYRKLYYPFRRTSTSCNDIFIGIIKTYQDFNQTIELYWWNLNIVLVAVVHTSVIETSFMPEELYFDAGHL